MSITRVIRGAVGVLTDLSESVEAYSGEGVTITDFDHTTDYLFIGQMHPFNHIYFKPGPSVNSNTGKLYVDYWDGDTWRECVEVRDGTDAFTHEGWITWVPNKLRGWLAEDTSSTEDAPTGDHVIGLENIIIYDHYWVRIRFENDPSAMDIAFVGQKFSEDSDLRAEAASLMDQSFLDAFGSAAGEKHDWNEQHVKVAEIIVNDMISKGIIWHKGQILTRQRLRLAAVAKLKELIYSEMGPDYESRKQAARDDYYRRLSRGVYEVDKNKSGRLDQREARESTGWLER